MPEDGFFICETNHVQSPQEPQSLPMRFFEPDRYNAHINIQLGSQMVRGSFARDAQPLHRAHD
jgi:hypothetical protein